MFDSFIALRPDSPYYRLFEKMRSIVDADTRVVRCGDRLIRASPLWVRDHIHEMKGAIYWESELRSFLDLLLEHQTGDGFFYEILALPGDRMNTEHMSYVNDSCKFSAPELGYGMLRIEVEADIEYLIVEGVHRVWQAEGDTGWVARHLPRLEKALRYCISHPKCWDETHRLMKRPRTIDTWDFLDRPDSGINRNIMPSDPMGIMHGDNSGLYAAMRQLAFLYEVCGHADQARRWLKEADGLRERANKLLWNGRFYIHQYPLDSTSYGMPEEEMLSLSNTYDINRGLPTHSMAVSIIDTYRELREQTGSFAEWFSIHPCYPRFERCEAGSYINGGIASFVAGELAHAAFQHGREAYGVDILRRIAQKVTEDKALYFLYDKDGRNQGGGPSGWGAAALIYALTGGLAGVRDEGCRFERVTIAPRWAATGEPWAHVRLVYGASRAAVEYTYTWDEAVGRLRLESMPGPKEIMWRILLPDGWDLQSTTVDGEAVTVELLKIEDSVYATIQITPSPDSKCLIDLRLTRRELFK